MDDALRQLVWERAADNCEYCRMPQRFDVLPFQLDHIMPSNATARPGPTIFAFAVKTTTPTRGPTWRASTPQTGQVTRLYHPRRDDWNEHFGWNGPELIGRTGIGRTTIDVLSRNLPERVEQRRLLIEAGVLRL